MIDGLSFFADVAEVSQNEHLKFKKQSVFNGLNVSVYNNANGVDVCTIRGSAHRFWNGGTHNANDYRLSDFIETLRVYEKEFGIKLETTKFFSCEFGVNVQLPATVSVQKLLKSIILYRGGRILKVKKDEKGVNIPFAQFALKIYDKGIQFKEYAGENTLRVEVSVEKTQYIRNKVIADCTMLADLAKPAVWRAFGDELLKRWDLLVICDDSIDVEALRTMGKISQNDADLLIEGRNVEYWDKVSGMARKRKLDEFTELTETYSSLKNDVKYLIDEKINSLIDVTKLPFYVTKLPNFVPKLPNFYDADNQDISQNDVMKLPVAKGELRNITPPPQDPMIQNANCEKGKKDWRDCYYEQLVSGVDWSCEKKIAEKNSFVENDCKEDVPVSELLDYVTGVLKNERNVCISEQIRKTLKYLKSELSTKDTVSRNYYDGVVSYLHNDGKLRIYQVCYAKGIGLERLAKMMNLPNTYIGRLAKGSSGRPNIVRLVSIADALGVPFYDLL